MPVEAAFARRSVLAAALCSAALLASCDNKSSSEDRAGFGKGGGVLRSSCQTEIEKLCSGEARAGRCLRNHQDELSATCKAALADRDSKK